MIAARIFAVLTAVFLVMAIGMATLAPLGLTLGQGATMLSRTALDWPKLHSPEWLWLSVAMPLLTRPLWFLPAVLGVVCGGLAATFTLGPASPSRRRRS